MAYELFHDSIQCLLVLGGPSRALPQTVNDTLILHLGCILLARVHGPSPLPIIKTISCGGLCGMIPGVVGSRLLK